VDDFITGYNKEIEKDNAGENSHIEQIEHIVAGDIQSVLPSLYLYKYFYDLYTANIVRDEDGLFNGAVVSPNHAHFLWYTSWIALVSFVYGFYRGHYDLMVGPLCVFLTSINYWRNPIRNSWRRYADIVVVCSVALYQLYRAMNAEYGIHYCIIVAFCGCSYVFSYYFAGSNEFLAMIFHSMVHIMANVSNMVLYSGWVAPIRKECIVVE
jgi:hypothetical protein